MALPAATAQFKQALIDAENVGATSAAEAAQKFGDAFIGFFEQAQVLVAFPVPGTTRLPSAVSVLVGGLTSAFEASGASAVSGLMEAAFFAYWNAGPFTAMFPAANAVAPTTPLYTYLQIMSTPDISQDSAKAKLAGAIRDWMMAGPLITLNPVPPGTTTTFV